MTVSDLPPAPAVFVEAAAALDASTGVAAGTRDLYAPAPSSRGSGATTSFYRRYGHTFEALELRQGVPMGTLTAQRDETTIASQRAGVGVTAGRGRAALLGLLVLLAAAAAAMVAAPAARAALPSQFLGVTTEDAYVGTDAYAQQQLKAQRAAGFTVVRQVFRWDEINPLANVFDFSATDRFVRNAAIAGMRVVPLLQGEPKWASSRPAGNTSRYIYPPRSVTTYAAFAGAIARRYGPGGEFWLGHPELTAYPITRYQLWNEPNFPLYWAGKPNPAAYAKLVIAAAASIRSFDKTAYIISAGLPDSKLGQKPERYVRRMLKAGAGKALDAIGIHPYAQTPALSLAIARQLRRAVNRAGGRKLDLWVTEIGWAAGGPKTPARTVTRAKQGPTIVAAVRKLTAARKSLRLKGIVYYAWRDAEVYAGGKDFWGLHTGLLDRNGKAKPALKVVSRALRKLKK
ncbi:MAG: hypothetical protein QM679_09810 [Patulibacter sp.]